LTYNLSERAKIKTDIKVSSQQGTPSNPIDTIADLAIKYSLSKDTSLEGKYNFINSDENRDDDDYQANTASLYVKITF